MDCIHYAIEAVKPHFVAPLLGVALVVLGIVVVDEMNVFEVGVEVVFC